MTPELVERVARAIAAVRTQSTAWETFSPGVQEQYRQEARAAIEVITEMDELMEYLYPRSEGFTDGPARPKS